MLWDRNGGRSVEFERRHPQAPNVIPGAKSTPQQGGDHTNDQKVVKSMVLRPCTELETEVEVSKSDDVKIGQEASDFNSPNESLLPDENFRKII